MVGGTGGIGLLNGGRKVPLSGFWSTSLRRRAISLIGGCLDVTGSGAGIAAGMGGGAGGSSTGAVGMMGCGAGMGGKTKRSGTGSTGGRGAG